jgi:hypothetical protein
VLAFQDHAALAPVVARAIGALENRTHQAAAEMERRWGAAGRGPLERAAGTRWTGGAWGGAGSP